MFHTFVHLGSRAMFHTCVHQGKLMTGYSLEVRSRSNSILLQVGVAELWEGSAVMLRVMFCPPEGRRADDRTLTLQGLAANDVLHLIKEKTFTLFNCYIY